MFEEIEEKKRILDSKRPLSEEVLRNLKEYFDVEWTYNSNAIEGNTLTLTETKLVLEDGLTVGRGKPLKDHLEAINHKEAIDYVEDIVKGNMDISEAVIKNIHYLLLKGIDDKNAGKYREANVLISGSKHIPPMNVLVPEKMNELITWYDKSKEIIHPIEHAAEFHLRFTYIHPFIDGNGRCARLLMNLILMRNSYVPAIIRMEDRLEYMDAHIH
ncbi:MAG: Fic family protein [Thermoanaerobacteraceae bacterium]|nr:Fic family protein [Thermoanaerobacteraceae bacterium]